MKIPMSAFKDTIEALIRSGAKRAVKYLDSNTTVKATCPHKARKNGRGQSIVVSFGRPNYAERQFIKKAGHRLPKVIQLKYWPVSRSA